jgi:hypothetical protein
MPYSKNPNRTCRQCGETFHCTTNSKLCDKCRYSKRNCLICGKEFITNLIHDTKTCSFVCGAKMRWGDVIKKRGERRAPCANCGKPITRKSMAYGKRKKEHNFCNVQCYGEWRHNNIFGEAHPRYTGGYSYAYGSGWFKQKALALARDKVCQRCGKTSEENGIELSVHHIKPFRFFGRSRAKEAHDLNNLICLCASCHQIVEWETFR